MVASIQELILVSLSSVLTTDSRLTSFADKEGPIHDVTWSPRSNSFAVVYGFMPAKTVVFNAKGEPIHTFPLGPRNTVLFSPHGRFVLVAGFGNLAGQTDIYDLEKDYAKICTIEGSNASLCEWSPDGEHILMATTSPRLRVDNGIRIWHAGGQLMYNDDMNELYHVTWRPGPPSAFPVKSNPFSPMPTPHESATKYQATKKTPSKPAGAYRPPGARGQITPLAFKREDEGGAAFVRESLSSFSSNVNGFGKPRTRVVPGAETVEDQSPLPPGAAPGGGVSLTGTGEGKDEPMSKTAKKNAKKREAKKAAAAAAQGGDGASTPSLTPDANRRSRSKSPGGRGHERRQSGIDGAPGHQRSRSKGYVPAPPGLGAHRDGQQRNGSRSDSRRERSGTANSNHTPSPHNHNHMNGAPRGPASQQKPRPTAPANLNTSPPAAPPPPAPAAPPEIEIMSPITPGASSDPRDKKMRGLLKKIRAIDDLKMRQANGEALEDTQKKKITSEDQVRKELASLGCVA